MSEQQYLNLLKDVLDNGTKKSIFGHEDKHIISRFGAMLRFDLSDGTIPIVTTKRTFYRGAIEEILWFCKDGGDVVKLHNRGVYIWDVWGLKHWNKQWHNRDNQQTLEEFQQKIDSGEIKSVVIPLHYTNGTAWQHYMPVDTYIDVDQTKWVIDQIQKNPDRKSYLVSYWKPSTTYHMASLCNEESVVLPACHVMYSLNVSQGNLSLLLYIRSWDLFLGAPFNIAQYGALLRMYCFCTGFQPGELIISVGDHHIYSDHVEQVKEMLERKPMQFPKLNIKDRGQKYLQDFVYEDFEIIDYKCHPSLKGEVTVVGGY